MSQKFAVPPHPDHADPWAMQLVVERKKREPADHLDALQAAGCAVVQLLDDPRAQPGGVWADAVAHWRAGWIRKVVRRAENKRWDDVQALDGVTAMSGNARVRAFVPGPVAPLPAQLKKLQVQGTQLPRFETGPATGVEALVTVEVTPVVELSTGKLAAQVGHAAQLMYERLCDDAAAGDRTAQHRLAVWRADGFRIRVVEPSCAVWEGSTRPIRVLDAGLTEVSGTTETARAFWGAS